MAHPRRHSRHPTSTARAGLLLTFGTLLIQGFQFLKLILTTSLFGASSGILDGYFAAMRWPLLLQGVLIGSIVAALIPAMQHLRSRGQYFRAEQIRVLSLMTALGIPLGLALPAWPFGDEILRLTVPGLSEIARLEAATLLPLCLLAAACAGTADLLGLFYVANRRFWPVAWVPALCVALSLVLIWFGRELGPQVLVLSALAASVLQIALFLILSRRSGRFRVRPRHAAIPRLPWAELGAALALVPVLLCAYATSLLDLYFAGSFPSGTISTLELSVRLHDVIVRLSVANLATALIPVFGQLATTDASFRPQIEKVLVIALCGLVPLAGLITFLAPYGVSLVFVRGNFTPTDAVSISAYWSIYALSLAPMALVHVGARALQALRARRLMLLLGVCLVLSHWASLWVLVPVLGPSGIPWSNFVSQLLKAIALLAALLWLRPSKQAGLSRTKFAHIMVLVGVYLAGLSLGHFCIEQTEWNVETVVSGTLSHRTVGLAIAAIPAGLWTFTLILLLRVRDLPGLEVLNRLGIRR